MKSLRVGYFIRVHSCQAFAVGQQRVNDCVSVLEHHVAVFRAPAPVAAVIYVLRYSLHISISNVPGPYLNQHRNDLLAYVCVDWVISAAMT